MARVTLTPQEREARRKARNRRVVEGGRTYTGERGSPSQWRGAADAALHCAAPVADPWLSLLGLATMPETRGALRAARRVAMLTAHADKGGTHAHAVAINDAYDRLVERMAKA